MLAGHKTLEEAKRYRRKIYFLSVSTFKGMVPWAIHWSGRIMWNTSDSFRNWQSKDFNYVNPDAEELRRFTDHSSVVRAAVGWFLKNRRRGDVLVYGNFASCGPHLVLVASRNKKKIANQLYEEAKKVGFWEVPKKMKRLEAQWGKLFCDYKT